MTLKRKLAIILFPLIRLFVAKPKVFSIDDTLSEIQKGKSMARFGDGELQAITKNIDKKSFQENNNKLSFEMQKAINLRDPRIINAVGIPFSWNLDALNKESREYWEPLLIKNWEKWGPILKDKQYYNAFITRPYFDLKDKNISKKVFNGFKKVWRNKKILLIEGQYSRFGVNDDLLSDCKKVYRLIGPAKNAFKKKKEISMYAKKIINDKDIDIVLISLGQTATILVGELLDLNVQILDIGHLDIEYNWFLTNAKEKCNIPGKWINEANPKFVEFTDNDILSRYRAQIVKVINSEEGK
ncbi:DUF1792 domain-containing protein [Lactobacillus helveticus]|uniref:GT-D fold domain-containing glycosyltransferase n=1 Tax=Lactobacillus helveticus TaxID=1587 RepID=UPI0013FDC492|nr:GT-D fold domain-containing glycosyltransferase [Lactobacillus helveticus]NHL83122.1 DUF1792 domain-containing protein [Lactobacillus helveticus]